MPSVFIVLITQVHFISEIEKPKIKNKVILASIILLSIKAIHLEFVSHPINESFEQILRNTLLEQLLV